MINPDSQINLWELLLWKEDVCLYDSHWVRIYKRGLLINRFQGEVREWFWLRERIDNERNYVLWSYMNCHFVFSIKGDRSKDSRVYILTTSWFDNTVWFQVLAESLNTSPIRCTLHYKYFNIFSPHYTIYSEKPF